MTAPEHHEALAFTDGAVVPLAEARLPLADRAVLFGEGLFETVRVVEGRPFAFERHLARVARAAERLSLSRALGEGALEQAAEAVLAAWGPRSGVLKLIVTAGAPPRCPPCVAAILEGPRPLPHGAREHGVSLDVAPWRRDARAPLAGLKSLAYLECLLTRRAAQARGHHDAVIVDATGRPSECTASSLLWVREGVLFTPALATGALPGIMREIVIEVAPEIGLACREESYPWSELRAADEVLITNALQGVLGVHRVAAFAAEPAVRLRAPGPATARLAAKVEELARTMIFGVMSDVHGNLEALEAVLLDMEEQQVELIVCLGDIVGYGPNPYEAAELVYCVAAATVRGNHEQMVCAERIDEFVSPLAATAARWTREQLRPHGRRPLRKQTQITTKHEIWGWLSDLPQTVRHDGFMFAHGTPEDVDTYIVTLEEAQRVFKEEMDGVQLLFVGHSHVPGIFHRNSDGRVDYVPGEFGKRYRIGRRPMIVNVGSVGQPRDYDTRSCYVVTDGRAIRFRRIDYDIDRTVERIYKELGLPNALADRLLCGE